MCDQLWQSLGGLSKECVTNYGRVWVACQRNVTNYSRVWVACKGNVRPIRAEFVWPVKGMCDQLWQSLGGLSKECVTNYSRVWVACQRNV